MNTTVIAATGPPPSAGPSSASTSIVDDLLELLGPAVLLAIPLGRKGPEDEGWQGTKPELMSDPAYRRRLEHGNIGVLLGTTGENLCSVDCDDDNAAQEFLQLNPGLADTLRTKGRRGCNFWVRIRGDYPRLVKLKTDRGADWGEWRSTGGQTVIHGLHPDGGRYRIVYRAHPVEISFDDIKWPPSLVLPWIVDRLVARYGNPVVLGIKGPTALNERFWAGLVMTENTLLHEPSEREFYLYTPETGLWKPVSAERLQDIVATRVFRYRTEAQDPRIEKLITSARIKAVVDTLRGMAEHRDAFQVHRSAVHVQNGVIRLAEDGDVRLTGFAPEDYSRNRSPIPFDAGAECPRFLQELLLPAMSAEDVDLLQRWAGMAITGRNPAQRIVILTGTSAGGKTTTASTISRIIGAENCYQLRTEVLAERFEVYRYRAKTLLVGADVPGDFLQRRGAGVLKALVGGDILAAEAKGLNSDLVLRGEFLVLITCNSRLKVRLEGDTAAWRRRLIVFEFKNPPPTRRITDFDQVLVREEGAGILRWCLQGFVKAHAELQEHGDLILTDTQRERVDALLCESDSVRHFVQEALSRSDDTDVSVEELTQAYAAFCTDKRWSPLDINEVTGQLPDLLLQIYGVTKRHDIRRYGKSVRGYSGITINTPPPGDEP